MADTDNISPVAPRGTDRVRRRAAQAEHAERATVEAATLQPPRGEEKVAAIAANKAAEVARFGNAPNRAKVRQAENREAALEQDRQFSGAPALQQFNLVPGQQVDHRTARLIAKAADREARDQITDAAKAAGKAVFQSLSDKAASNKNSVFRKVARQAAKVAASGQQ
jgi:hypothetical protein